MPLPIFTTVATYRLPSFLRPLFSPPPPSPLPFAFTPATLDFILFTSPPPHSPHRPSPSPPSKQAHDINDYEIFILHTLYDPPSKQAHDINDYEIGKRHKLQQINILNKDATMNAACGAYEGLDRSESLCSPRG